MGASNFGNALMDKIHVVYIIITICSTHNNADSNKLVIFSGIALYYGDNDVIIQTFSFFACSDAARVTYST